MRLIVTAMKNEGPFILEWVAYHLSIGFDRFLTYSNDCEDGTDLIWDRLAELGYGAHERNHDILPRGVQKTALLRADGHPLTEEATWIACLDVDEFLNVKRGEGRLDDLFGSIPDADMIMLCWRRFGAAGIAGFRDAPVIEQFDRAAPEICPYPFHNYGFKSLWRRGAGWARIGVHRPLDPDPARVDQLRVFTADGTAAGRYREKGIWLTAETAGYAGAQLNHYSLRSAESFLVKCDRGLANARTSAPDLGYWAERNFNQVEDRSILRRLPEMRARLNRLKADQTLARLHEQSVVWHKTRARSLLTEAEPLKLFLRTLVTQTATAPAEAAEKLNPMMARVWAMEAAGRAAAESAPAPVDATTASMADDVAQDLTVRAAGR